MRLIAMAGAALVLLATPARAEEDPAPADFTPAALQMAETYAVKCRALYRLISEGSKTADAWSVVSRGLPPQDHKVLAFGCLLYGKAWRQGGIDLATAMQGETLTERTKPEQ